MHNEPSRIGELLSLMLATFQIPISYVLAIVWIVLGIVAKKEYRPVVRYRRRQGCQYLEAGSISTGSITIKFSAQIVLGYR